MDTEQQTESARKEVIAMVDRLIADFSRHVEAETDLTNVLLKGHLLVENYMSSLVVLLYDTELNVSRLSFYDKVKRIEEKKIINPNYVRSLFALNDLRNAIAHELEYKVTESSIDSIGFYLGKEYIIQKHTHEGSRELLLWALDEIVTWVFYAIFKEIRASQGPPQKKAR